MRLEQAGIENYLPVREVEFVRNGQERRLEIPVITGCIFVHVPETSLPSVLSILGVIALLRKERVPIVISDKQLDSLRMLCEHSETLEVVNEGLPAESVIRLIQGGQARVQGELSEVAGEHRVVVRIPYLVECVARVKV